MLVPKRCTGRTSLTVVYFFLVFFFAPFLGRLTLFFFLLFLASPSYASPGQKAARQASRFGKNKEGNIGEVIESQRPHDG